MIWKILNRCIFCCCQNAKGVGQKIGPLPTVSFAMRKVLPGSLVLKDEFHFELIRIEGLLNNLPTSELSESPEDDDCITPNHFLLGKLYVPLVPDSENLKVGLDQVNKLLVFFWNILVESQPSFQTLPKWFRKRMNFRKGQIVIVLERDVLRFQWTKGRIMEIFTSGDGLPRNFVIKMGKKGKLYRRSAQMIMPLLDDCRDIHDPGDISGQAVEDEDLSE